MVIIVRKSLGGWNVGYLAKVKSKGRTYWYLKEYAGKQPFKMNRERTIFNFGNEENALAKMHFWKVKSDYFPVELIDLGYGKDDLQSWINQIELVRFSLKKVD